MSKVAEIAFTDYDASVVSPGPPTGACRFW